MKQLSKLSNIRKLSKTFVNYVSKGIPFPTNLSFDFNTRTDSLINDSVSGLNAEVVGGYVGVFDGSSNISIPSTAVISGGYFKISFNRDSTTTSYLISSRASSTQFSRIGIGSILNTISIYVQKLSDDTVLSNDFVFSTDFVVGTYETIIGEVIGSILNLTKVSTGEIVSFDYGEPIFFRFDLIGSYVGTSFFKGSLCCVAINASLSYLFNGNFINTVDGIEATNNGVTFELNNSDTLPSTTTALNNGYYLELATGVKVIDPQYPLPAIGWVHILGGGVHNLIDSYVRFPAGIMDRSIAFGMFNNLSRSSIYYNDQDTRLHHISELPYDILQLTLEAVWLDRIFSGYNTNYGDKLELFEFFGYLDKKSGQDLTDVLLYIKYLYTIGGLVFYYADNSQYIPLIF